MPIPLGSRRLRTRGYNQSERIAAALGRRLGAPVRTDLLVRNRETGTQTALTPEQRHANVPRGVPRWHGTCNAAGTRLVLVDDVFTTGATLVAAATALADVNAGTGAVSIEAVTFARAATFDMNL